jgi:hypothetical protein
MSQWTIGSKIGGGFTWVLFLMLCISAFCIWIMTRASAGLNLVVSTSLPETQLAVQGTLDKGCMRFGDAKNGLAKLERLLTQASAIENVSHSGRDVINPQRRYGDMPLIVLTSGSHPMPPQVPAEVREHAALFFGALASGHHAYTELSTRGHNQVISNSGPTWTSPPLPGGCRHRLLSRRCR